MQKDTDYVEYNQMVLQNPIQLDQEHERDVQPPQSTESDEILITKIVFGPPKRDRVSISGVQVSLPVEGG